MNAKHTNIIVIFALAGLILSSCEGKDQSKSPDPTSTDSDASGSGTIDAVFFAQTHVLQANHEYSTLVGNRETLIKAHVVSPEKPTAPAVKAILSLNGKTLDLPLTGPEVLPASIAIDPGVVQHSYEDSFTGYIPKEWMQPGLSVTVEAAADRMEWSDLNIGAPTKVIMTMFDVQYFADTTGDYPSGWQEELEAKWPVAELEVRRLPHVVFPELVIPPRAEVVAARVSSKDEYKVKTGLDFDGEQAAALQWKSALKAAAGTGGRISLYYVNIYGANAGGQAGGFGGVGNGTAVGILNHELGHALSLGDCYGNDPNYPYKGDMYGIPQPVADNDLHVGPTWAYYVYDKAFIPPTVQPNSVGGTVGTYKRDPMCGGGQGDQEQGYLMRHFSDYSVSRMRSFLEEHVVIWNEDLESYASWDSESNDYTKVVSNNGVSYPVERDVSVLSVMASISGANQDVNMVYPPIGPYVAGLIELFDPRQAADREAAETKFCPGDGCDVSLKIVQGGVEKVYMLAASWDTAADPLNGNSLTTKALNLRASDGAVTRVDLWLTPDAEHNGLPSTPTVLYSWTE